MKQRLLLFITFLYCSITGQLQAQTDVSIGIGTAANAASTYPSPLQDWNEGSRAQYLYTAAELTAAGMVPGTISAIKFNVTNLNAFTGSVEELTIRMSTTSTASLSATSWETVPVTNLYGPVNYVPVLGINTFQLAAPVVWDGSTNIIVEVCNGAANNASSNTFSNNVSIPWTTGLSFNGSHTMVANNLGNMCGTSTTANTGTQTSRPNITFTNTAAAACSGTPVGGTAVASLTNITCPGTPFTLSLSGATLASGLAYSWQYSTDNSTWTTTGANTLLYTLVQTDLVRYYRAMVTCTNGGASAVSAAVQVTSAAPPVYAPLPYIESFENTWINSCATRDIPKASWKNTPPTGNASWRRQDDFSGGGWTSNLGAYTPAAAVGTSSARFHSSGVAATAPGTLDLYLNCNTTIPVKRILFDYINPGGSDSLSVLLSTDGGSTFTRLDSAGTAPVWRNKSILFNSTSTTTIIRFRGAGNFDATDLGIDNLNIAEFDDCTGTPVGGTTVSSTATACLNTAFTLSITGATDANRLTYQWQVLSGGVWVNITGATGTTYNAAQAVSTSYRRITTCANGGASAISTPVLVSTPPPVAGTYTINSAVSTGGSNFQTFNAAYDYIKCGINGAVVFDVNPTSGPYNEQLLITAVPGTSVVNTVTFNGNGRTIRFSSTNANERSVIKLDNVAHIRFDSLVIDATPVGTGTTYGYGILLTNNADSNTIRRCTINTALNTVSTAYAGIVISAAANNAVATGNAPCDSNYIARNTINGGYYGITLVGSATNAVQRNVVANNRISDFYLYGMYLQGNFSALVEGNDISRPNATTVSTFNGIHLTGINVGVTVSRNRIHNPFDGATANTSAFYGITHTNADAITGFENQVTNNAIYNVNGQGNVYGIYNSGSDNIWYYHNTISLDNPVGAITGDTRGFFQTAGTGGVQFLNNVISITRGGNSTKYAVYLGVSTMGQGNTLNNNTYYVNAGGGASYTGYFNGNQASLADWQAATAADLNALSTNPYFTAPATGDYTPRSAVMDNKGAPVGITTDIINAARSATTPDMGAFEFAIPVCTSPPVAGVAVASPNGGICLGATINLSLSGYTNLAGQTVQWQYAATAAGPWTNLGGVSLVPDTAISATVTLYYRAIVTCSGNSTIATPVLVSINPALLSGIYTINPAVPASATNYQSFTTAVAALECGISGFVTFNVSPGTYNERVRMHRVFGTGPNSRITFQSLTGVPGSVTLTSGAATPTSNYVLQLDSASYVTYRNISIASTNATSARVVDVANNASYDSLLNCMITMPVAASSANPPASAGIFSNTLVGTSNVLKGNTIVNGGTGIYLTGISALQSTGRNIIDSNTVTGSYFYGIYVGFTNRVQVTNNKINTAAPLNATAYSIYSNNCDTAYQFTGNSITISNATGTAYGIYINNGTNTPAERGRIANNSIQAVTGNTGTLYGLYLSFSSFIHTVNNVINLRTTGTTSFGLYSNYSSYNNFWNNTVQNASPAIGNSNAAAYFNHTSGFYGNVNIQNNIFSHTGGGRAMSFSSVDFVYSDYNLLYTTGATLVASTTPVATYASLDAWRTGTGWDQRSIVYPPAFVSAGNLAPNSADPSVWAIHGRGTQLIGNDYDFNNNPRPVTLQAGVPDLGAYEFVPTVAPVALTATPAAPVAGTTQVFMLGTDTVTTISWQAGGPVPPLVTLRRYSGVLPPGVAAASPRMYFYVDADTMPVANYNTTIRQFYIDSWQGFINDQASIKMGKTEVNGNWVVNQQTVVNELEDHITETGVNYLDKFTGLIDGALPTVPQVINTGDSSNQGTQFWVGYGHNDFFNSANEQTMVLYLSAAQAATVTVRVNGTSYRRSYTVPANGAIVTDPIPKTGTQDARLLVEGQSDRGISITSDVPIAAYAHIYQSASAGATMLLPVGTYGYEYTSLNTPQGYSAINYSWVNVIAAYDSTLVQITPAKPTIGGRAAGQPFTVLLNKGEVYQLLGAMERVGVGYDMSGTKVISIANASGKCYPIAVFSGSSRTGFGCNGSTVGNADNNIQQNLPSQAWGKRYLTAPISTSADATSFMTNIYRVAVKDPTTVVTRNGVILTGLINNYFYQFESNTADYIQADKPVMVAQLESSSLSNCANTAGNGDPELFYLTPIEQGIKKANLFRTFQSGIKQQYVTLILPTTGVASLRIDGSNIFDHTYAHPNLAGYTVVIKRWGVAANGVVNMTSDSAFTGISYGLGEIESYGYNVGMLVKNPGAASLLNNTLNNTGMPNQYTCARTPFRVSILLPVKPTRLFWNFSALINITPGSDVNQLNPMVIDSTLMNGVWYYRYTVSQDYVIADSGIYTIPVTYYSPAIEGCTNSITYLLRIVVRSAVRANFTAVPLTACVDEPVQLNGNGTSGAAIINRWNWRFPDATTSSLQNPAKAFATPGVKLIELRVTTAEGCVGDTSKSITINPLPLLALLRDTLTICPGQNDTLRVQNPVTGTIYRWYTVATGGTAIYTGPDFPVTTTGTYYAEATSSLGCTSTPRQRAVVTVYAALPAPVATVDSAGTNLVRFRWNAVAGAVSYSVSTNGGTTFSTPTAGATGLTHTVSPLSPAATVSLVVRANGAVSCQNSVSTQVTGRTFPDQIYIPNAFTPNGDGRNDTWQVYSYMIRSIQVNIFNQWGQKIFESNNQQTGWDGTFKGQQQPVGVYVYVVKMTLNDGSTIDRKGSVNLVR